MTPKVLIIYHSRHGSVAAMANKIAIGAQSAGAEVTIRTVSGTGDTTTNEHLAHPVVRKDELLTAHAIVTGSPVRFGQMSAPLKQFWEQTSDLWLQGALIDKLGGVFTASASLHGGQEANLLGMMLPMLHHGMLIVGQPYDAPELLQTQTGGTPYGPSHVSGAQQTVSLSPDEQRLCLVFGKRIAGLAAKLV